MFLDVEPCKLLMPHETLVTATVAAITDVYEIALDGFNDRSGAEPCGATLRHGKGKSLYRAGFSIKGGVMKKPRRLRERITKMHLTVVTMGKRGSLQTQSYEKI